MIRFYGSIMTISVNAYVMWTVGEMFTVAWGSQMHCHSIGDVHKCINKILRPSRITVKWANSGEL